MVKKSVIYLIEVVVFHSVGFTLASTVSAAVAKPPQ